MDHLNPVGVKLWYERAGGVAESLPLVEQLAIGPPGVVSIPAGDLNAHAVTLQPVVAGDGIVAVAFVHVQSAGSLVALNGSPVADGLQPLRHADLIEIAGRSFWISAELSPQRVQYDTELHGPDVRCVVTKARLREGDEIVVCPGVPSKSCGAIYLAKAWDAVTAADGAERCVRCGFRPDQAPWQPPLPKCRKELLHGVSQIIARR